MCVFSSPLRWLLRLQSSCEVGGFDFANEGEKEKDSCVVEERRALTAFTCSRDHMSALVRQYSLRPLCFRTTIQLVAMLP